MAKSSSSTINKKLAGKKIRKKSSWPIVAGIIAVIIIAVIVIISSMGPNKATISYGICKTFLELNVRHPQTIKMIQVYDRVVNVEMDYRYMDEYGQIRTERMTCEFGKIEETGTTGVTKIIRKEIGHTKYEIPKEKIDLFNKSIPAIVNSSIDLSIPPWMPIDIKLTQLKDW